MKVTKAKAAENRDALLRAAGTLFREKGIDGVGVAEISEAAGLTHGALYAQFPSKSSLAAEALAKALRDGYERMTSVNDGNVTLTDLLDFRISARQRDNIARGCPMTASASEIARQDRDVRERFVEGFERTVAAIEAVAGGAPLSASRRQRALAIVAAEIGAIAIARAAKESSPHLSDELIAAVRHVAGEIGGEH